MAFSDAELISEKARSSLSKLYALGIISGRPDNRIDSKATLNRAEFAALAHRIADLD